MITVRGGITAIRRFSWPVTNPKCEVFRASHDHTHPLRTAAIAGRQHRGWIRQGAPPSRQDEIVVTRSWLTEPISTAVPIDPHPSLANEDSLPAKERSFSMWDMVALWIGLVVCIPSWFLATSLVDLGTRKSENFSGVRPEYVAVPRTLVFWNSHDSLGVLVVLLGNLITLVPMVMCAHPGTKYGVPFPVLARSAFGVKGASLPALLRWTNLSLVNTLYGWAVVACGWFGIQTWVGSAAIHQMLSMATGGATVQAPVAWLGISYPQLGCFLLFWAMQVAIIVRGIESIRDVEKAAAPLLIGLSAALLWWAVSAAGGFGPMLGQPSQFGAGMAQEGQFWKVFWPAITANVGFWATISLNIPDFTRYAKNQKDQVLGQIIGLPLFMALFAFVGLAVTSATVPIFGVMISDPIELMGYLDGALPVFLSLVGLIMATLSTNIAANVVPVANALVNLAPQRISFAAGGVIASLAGIMIQPWRLVADTQGFIYTWLIGYSALLGPLCGISICDYWLVKQRQLDLDALYSISPEAEYWYKGGWNPVALLALAAGVAPNVPGFLVSAKVWENAHPLLLQSFSFAWFIGFALSALVYYIGMRAMGTPRLSIPAV